MEVRGSKITENRLELSQMMNLSFLIVRSKISAAAAADGGILLPMKSRVYGSEHKTHSQGNFKL